MKSEFPSETMQGKKNGVKYLKFWEENKQKGPT